MNGKTGTATIEHDAHDDGTRTSRLGTAEFRPISTLVPWTENYNVGNVSAIARSIETFGFNGRLAVHGSTVMAGNHALAALQRLREAGAAFPGGKGLRLDADGGWSVLVTPLDHLSWEQAEAFAIADNRTRDLATTDEERLAVLLREIAERDEDELLATGYDIDDVENLLRRLGQLDDDRPDAPEPRLDRLNELVEEWGTAPGQLWVIPSQTCPGKAHRILCGDSTDAAQVRRLMNGERAVLFATDPPYLVGYDGTNHPQGAKKRAKSGDGNKDWSAVYVDADWDSPENGWELYDGFISVAIAEAVTLDAAWYCWHASRNQAKLEAMWNKYGAFMHQQIIWMKAHPVLTRSWYMWRHEPCMFGWIKGQKPAKITDVYPHSVWEFAKSDSDTSQDHPTSKPVELWEIPIAEHTRRGDICYEPFIGSGTHHIAAERTGRICYGVELQPGFVAVTLERLREMGLEPRLVSADEPTETVTAQ